MTKRDKIFYIVCASLVCVTVTFLLNIWYKFIPFSHIDKYVIVLFFAVIGLSLLPFADKIKIGNLFEIERLKQAIEDVQLHQYIGEIISTPQGTIFYYDSDGTHTLPDMETAEFLRSKKGVVNITANVFSRMKSSYSLESVVTANKIKWGGQHLFVLLNGKKYWISPTDMANIGIPRGNSKDFKEVTDEQIKLIPTGK